MKRAIVGVLAISLGLLIKSCDTTDPPDNKTLTLKLEDVSCTEAWIELTTTNLQLPATVTLKQTSSNGDTKSHISILNTQDSLLYVDSLLPNTSYIFQAVNDGNRVSSNAVNVTTLDTTSQNFSFQTWTFGGAASSSLRDVAIIDRDNIWCVGEIYMNDSLGNPDPIPYNAVHWDGSQWELKRINMESSCNPVTYPPLRAIWAFSENNIVVTSGGSIGWFDGITNIPDCTIRPLLTGSINKIWGSSSNDLYVVGNNGNIARYLNGTWSRIESGTTTNINDVWGGVDIDGIDKIYFAVSNVIQSGDQKILTIKNNKVDSLSWNTGRRIHSIWTSSNSYLYTAGGGIFENIRGYWNEITEVPLYYSRNIRGIIINSIFVCGDFGLFAHFNGAGWKTFNELYTQGIYYAVAVKNNIVVTVGFEGSKAIIVKGFGN